MEILALAISTVTLFIVLLAYFERPKKALNASGGVAVVLDTSAIIDGRILELTASGFMPENLVIPQFVLAELQMLADGKDPHKRERARYGLDVVKQLQESKNCKVRIERGAFEQIAEVDDKLVALAKQLKARLYTTDYNLNKVADIEGITVLNVNELAQQMRPIVLPGETRQVKIIQKGSSPKQGVGYLDDGTMVVVDNAAGKIGKSVSVTFSKTFQTQAGKMLFAELAPRDGETKARQ